MGTFDLVGAFDLTSGHFRPKMWALSTLWADLTFHVGGFNLRVGMFDRDSNPNPNPNDDHLAAHALLGPN